MCILLIYFHFTQDCKLSPTYFVVSAHKCTFRFHFIYKESEEAPADTFEPADGVQIAEVETGLFIIYLSIIICFKGDDVLLMNSPREI